MKIKKLGHCCLVLEINSKRIMTDPSDFNYGGDSVSEKDISLILITHEHADHLHIDTLRQILQNNPNTKVISNTSVGKLLAEAGIDFIKVEDGEIYDFDGILIKGFGDKHAQIYEEYGQVQNTGYMVDPFINTEFDFEKIKSVCDNFTIIHADNDNKVPFSHAEFFEKNLDCKLIVNVGAGHMSSGENCFELPQALDALLEMINK